MKRPRGGMIITPADAKLILRMMEPLQSEGNSSFESLRKRLFKCAAKAAGEVR